jgi:hypothetical protein
VGTEGRWKENARRTADMKDWNKKNYDLQIEHC